jgi:hypothetical protein
MNTPHLFLWLIFGLLQGALLVWLCFVLLSMMDSLLGKSINLLTLTRAQIYKLMPDKPEEDTYAFCARYYPPSAFRKELGFKWYFPQTWNIKLDRFKEAARRIAKKEVLRSAYGNPARFRKIPVQRYEVFIVGVVPNERAYAVIQETVNKSCEVWAILVVFGTGTSADAAYMLALKQLSQWDTTMIRPPQDLTKIQTLEEQLSKTNMRDLTTDRSATFAIAIAVG